MLSIRKARFRSALVVIGLCGWAHGGWAQEVCNNEPLKRAVSIVAGACSELSGCNFEALREIDRINRPALLAALRDPAVLPVHVFYDMNVSDLTRSIGWSAKRDILGTYEYLTGIERATLFVLGQASDIGDFDTNVRLSRERMQGVLLYLRDVLKIKCVAIKGGYLGAKIFKLTPSDASALNIDPTEYRGDPNVLNQSVHVFVFPCSNMR